MAGFNPDGTFNLDFGSRQRVAPSYLSPGTAALMGYQPNQNSFNWNQDFGNGGGGGAAQPNFGWNMPTVGLGLYGLSTLGNLWQGFQANKIAKDQLAWAKEFGNANLNNSIKNYNTSLEDKARSRASSSGWSPEQIDAYVQANKVSR